MPNREPSEKAGLRCGVDLIEVDRVRKAIEKHGERFLGRIFTAEERDYCQSKQSPWPHYAARFAAKEAFFKSLPPGTLDTLVWREIGVTRHSSGSPSLVFTGTTAERVVNLRFALSLSHLRSMAIACVIAEPAATP